MKEGNLSIEALDLELGGTLRDLTVRYHSRGVEEGLPVVWVFHALTANSRPDQWWSGLFAKDGYFKDFAVVCVNVLGSPYGSSSPLTHGGAVFPKLTVRDVAATQLAVARHLGITHIHTAIGGSFGGYQALEFARAFSGRIDHLVLLATAAEEKPWNKAIHEAQRMAIEADPTFGQPGGGARGLAAARAMGMINYRTPQQYNNTQRDQSNDVGHVPRAASYVRYQGQKLVERFDAQCYYALTLLLDTHQVSRGFNSAAQALAQLTMPALVLALSSDLLVPAQTVEELALALPNARYECVVSDFGHDGFLLEFEQIKQALNGFYHG